MRSKLNRFLRYLQVEKGASQGTIEVYQRDIEKELIPFLHHLLRKQLSEQDFIPSMTLLLFLNANDFLLLRMTAKRNMLREG